MQFSTTYIDIHLVRFLNNLLGLLKAKNIYYMTVNIDNKIR